MSQANMSRLSIIYFIISSRQCSFTIAVQRNRWQRLKQIKTNKAEL